MSIYAIIFESARLPNPIHGKIKFELNPNNRRFLLAAANGYIVI
jgi:hypothetical protein